MFQVFRLVLLLVIPVRGRHIFSQRVVSIVPGQLLEKLGILLQYTKAENSMVTQKFFKKYTVTCQGIFINHGIIIRNKSLSSSSSISLLVNVFEKVRTVFWDNS